MNEGEEERSSLELGEFDFAIFPLFGEALFVRFGLSSPGMSSSIRSSMSIRSASNPLAWSFRKKASSIRKVSMLLTVASPFLIGRVKMVVTSALVRKPSSSLSKIANAFSNDPRVVACAGSAIVMLDIARLQATR